MLVVVIESGSSVWFSKEDLVIRGGMQLVHNCYLHVDPSMCLGKNTNRAEDQEPWVISEATNSPGNLGRP